MGKSNLIQTDFLAGEISPRMEMQDTLEGRKHGVELMENFFTHLQGTAETSRGTEYTDVLVGTSGRLIGFPVRFLTSFMVAISNGAIKVYGQLGLAKNGDLLSNGYFDEGGTDWDEETVVGSSVVFLPGGVRLSGGYSGGHAKVSQLQAIAVEVTLEVAIAFGKGPVTIEVGSAAGLNDILSEVAYGVGRKAFPGLNSGTGNMFVRITLEDFDDDITVSDIHLYDATATDADFTAVWDTQSDTESIQAHMLPNEASMVFTSAGFPPQLLSFSGGDWSFAPMPLTGAPSIWAADNYPPAVGFFANRMWVGGVASDPSLFWGSKITSPPDYGDFTLGTLANDAIEARLGRQGSISWIAGGAGLLIGTSNAEHIIYGEGGVIVPGDINSKIQSTNGSYPTQSLDVGNDVMHVTPDGRKIRSLGYEWAKDAWRSRDLTHASEHITKDNEITNLVYLPNPDSIIVGRTRAGQLISATYEPYSQDAGFSRRSTQGSIISVGAVSFGGADELWMLVEREGNGQINLERDRHPDNTKLDSFTIFTSGVEISSGVVPHLAGVTCQVVVDGALHPDIAVGPSGEFTTEWAGYEIQIGLQISSIIVTLPVADVGKTGTTRSMKKRWTEIWVRIIDSWRPKINGRRPPNRRAPSIMGEVEPALTESVEVSNTGTDLEGKITIEQDLPLRTEVAGWFGRLIQEET